MQPIPSLFSTFQGALSVERLAPYSGKSEIEALTLYAWNIALSEALYPSLQNLEIAMRNRIDAAINSSYGDPWWFQDTAIIVEFSERNEVENAETRLQKRGQSVTPSAIVSELTFGFWSRLLSSSYDVVIWRRPTILEAAFPYLPTPRRRDELFTRFEEIRKLRNHVFHHEAIMHLDLKTEHANIMQAMGWLDPSLQKVTKALDRFPDVDTKHYKNNLKIKLMSACPVETKVLLATRKVARAYYRFL